MAKLIHLIVNMLSGFALRLTILATVFSVNQTYAYALLALYLINHTSNYLYSVEMVKEFKSMGSQLRAVNKDEV